MARDTPPSDHSFVARLLDRLKRHPIVLLLVTIGAVVAFATNLRANLMNWIQPDPPPVVRMQRFQLSGDAVSLMLLGRMDDRLQKTLGGRPVVWRNSVYDQAVTLHNRFARPLGTNELNETDGNELHGIGGETLLLSGAVARTMGLDPQKVFAMTGAPPNNGWRVAFVAEATPAEISNAMATGELPAPNLLFSRHVSCAVAMRLLAEVGEPESAFYASLVKDGCGELKVPLTARYEDISCGGEGWQVTLTLPKIRMDVLVIANLSEKPIRLNKISGPALAGSRVGDGTLTGEERLIIPTALLLESPSMDESSALPTLPIAQLTLPSVQSDLRITFYSTTVVEPAGDRPDSTEAAGSPDGGEVAAPPAADAAVMDAAVVDTVVDAGEAAQTTTRVPQFTLSVQELVNAYEDVRATPSKPIHIVPELEISSLEVDGVDIAVQPVDAGGTYISNSSVGASCPHLLLAGPDGQAIQLGKILIGRDSPARLGTNRRHLQSWPAGIAVAEADPEVTYLHGIKAVCEEADGSRSEYPGKFPSLASTAFPIRLAKGEQMAFTFGRPAAPGRCATIYVEVAGYYVPTTGQLAAALRMSKGFAP